MNIKKIVLGTVAYTVVTFTIAVVWHVVIFESQYLTFGYFNGQPNFLLGFFTILLQGILLSILYPIVKLSGTDIARGMKFALLIGLFFWTSHVLAFLAKQDVNGSMMFAGMETLYLAVQFGLFGLLISRVYPTQVS